MSNRLLTTCALSTVIVGVWPREEAITRLPLTYQRLLHWLDDGRSRDEIAAELDIDPQAVESLEHLARAKLARLATPNPRGAGRSARGRSPE